MRLKSRVHLHFCSLWLRRTLFESGPASPCFSQPSQTPHSWQRMTTGIKTVERFNTTSTSTRLTPPGPSTGEITGHLPLFFFPLLLLAQTNRCESARHAMLFKRRSKENTRMNKSANPVSPCCFSGPGLSQQDVTNTQSIWNVPVVSESHSAKAGRTNPPILGAWRGKEKKKS